MITKESFRTECCDAVPDTEPELVESGRYVTCATTDQSVWVPDQFQARCSKCQEFSLLWRDDE